MSAFLKDIFQQHFKVQKSVFMKCYSYIKQCYSIAKATYFITMWQFISEENSSIRRKYSLIWKAKPLTIEKKQVKYDKNGLLGRHHSLETSYIINFILKTFQLPIMKIF